MMMVNQLTCENNTNITISQNNYNWHSIAMLLSPDTAQTAVSTQFVRRFQSRPMQTRATPLWPLPLTSYTDEVRSIYSLSLRFIDCTLQLITCSSVLWGCQFIALTAIFDCTQANWTPCMSLHSCSFARISAHKSKYKCQIDRQVFKARNNIMK